MHIQSPHGYINSFIERDIGVKNFHIERTYTHSRVQFRFKFFRSSRDTQCKDVNKLHGAIEGVALLVINTYEQVERNTLVFRVVFHLIDCSRTDFQL